MRTTTLKCDRCGAEWPTSRQEQFWPVAVVLGKCDAGPISSYHGSVSHIVKQEEWCRPCVDAVHLLRGYEPPPKPGETPPAPPTLEDLIREIAREAATEVVQERS